MKTWTKDYTQKCIDHAVTISGPCVLRGAARHYNALYVFVSTINIFHAVRYSLPTEDSVQFAWTCISPNMLGEYYEDVKWDQIDLREFGYWFPGSVY